MLLIIHGPQGPGKRIISEQIAHSAKGRWYDEMPPQKPADLPSEGFVIITTDSKNFPAWVHDSPYAVVSPGFYRQPPRPRPKAIDEKALIAALSEYLNSGIDYMAFQCMAKGVDNTNATIFQYKGNVPVGEYFLCDCIGNTVDLCIATRRNYRNPAGRSVPAKVIATIIPDARKTLGSPVNGEWMIPYNIIKI